MFCGVCQNDFPKDCKCEDKKERLASLKGLKHFTMRWCDRCDNHYAECHCEEPIWITT